MHLSRRNVNQLEFEKKINSELKKDSEKDKSYFWWKEEAFLWREITKLGTLQFEEEKDEGDILKAPEIIIMVDEMNLIHLVGKIPCTYRRLI